MSSLLADHFLTPDSSHFRSSTLMHRISRFFSAVNWFESFVKTRQRERENKGIAVPPCPLCIQSHHTAGRRHDPQLTAQICEMHHRAIHEQILRAGICLEYEPDRVKRVALALRAAAVYDRFDCSPLCEQRPSGICSSGRASG
jgi:hypothetical protein